MKKHVLKQLLVGFAIYLIANTSANAQCTITASQDTTVCANGDTVRLSASSGASPFAYSWSPSSGLSNPTIANPLATINNSITYCVTASFLSSTELVTNGDFESGNTGFLSDYTYEPSPIPGTNNLGLAEYYVGTDPSAIHDCFAACTDHTSGSGKMMIINGASSSNVKVWKQTVSVTTNTDYALSAWINNVTCGVGYNAKLQFSIGGSLLGDTLISDSALCSWKQFYQVWNSGSNTSVEISIVNQNTDANGNDFAIDDISFREICYAKDSVSITLSPIQFSQNLILCGLNDSIQLPSGSWVDTVGTYYDTIQTAGECDSIITTNITLFTETELVTNGDFESGNTGFLSDYTYEPSPIPGTNNLGLAKYFVGTDPSATHNCFAACTDHTSGSGNMMIINGASSSNVKVWKQTVSVTTNTYYALSAWINNVTCGVGYNAKLQFSIGGSLLGDTLISDSALCSWKQFYQVWNSGSNTSVEISIVNQNTDANGNDFALDDISFKEICPSDTGDLYFSKTGQILGTKHYDKKNGLKVYPNPTKEKLYIEVSNTTESDYKVIVFSLTGKMLLSKQFTQSTGVLDIDLDGLSNGTYIANISTLDGMVNENHKIIIIK